MLIFRSGSPIESSISGVHRHIIRILWVFIFTISTGLLFVQPILAQDTSEQEVTLAQVQKLKEDVTDNAVLDAALRTRLIELYDQAINDLQNTQKFETSMAGYRLEQGNIEPRVAAIRSELDRTQPTELSIREGVEADEVANILTRDQAQLASLRTALRNIEQLAERRVARRGEIARRLGTLDQEIESVNDELLSISLMNYAPELKEAARLRLLTLRRSLFIESDALRMELELVEARGALLSWQRDLAELRVANSDKLVSQLTQKLFELREKENQESLEEVQRQSEEIAQQLPQLAEVAERTKQLAQMLWGTDGIISQSRLADELRAGIRQNIADINSISQLTRRRFDAVGQMGDINQWFPELPDGFPSIAGVRRELNRLERQIPDVQHQLIQLEQERARFREFESSVTEKAQVVGPYPEGQTPPDNMPLVRDQVKSRRELLDSLIDYYGRYSDRLVELTALMQNFISQGEELKSFAYERVLWARSTRGSLFPSPQTLMDAFRWLTAGEYWSPLFGVLWETVSTHVLATVLLLAFLVLLLRYRGPMKRRILALSKRVGDPSKDSLRISIETLVLTILLAAPVPLVLYVTGRDLARADTYPFLVGAGQALVWLASINFLFELLRKLILLQGLANAHFHWPLEGIKPVKRGLVWLQLIFLPLIYVAVLFGILGFEIDTTSQLWSYNSSLGRLAFIAGMAGLGLTLGGVIIPRWNNPVNRRVSLYAMPVIFLCFLLPALLAVFGYHLTGYLLAYQILQLLWLGMGIVIIGGMAFRWLDTRRSHPEADGDIAVSPQQQQREANIRNAGAQIRQMVRFILIVMAIIGVFSIWSEAMLTLQILKRVQIWPSISLMEPTTEPHIPLTSAQPTTGDRESPPNKPDVTATGVLQLPSDSEKADTSSRDTPKDAILTLWMFLKALLAGLITFILVKNIPGVVELLLIKRTLLDSGARIALSTLVRYTVMIMGLGITFGYLGISWSKVQWLAAALTVGLGFGLQEIVANFVSGIILLLERPVRVGDAVTIDTLQGRVTQTRIRATTITLWDRSEMIVPNKEFITKKLINWTLSDSRRRLDIPIRVAYGTEPEQVKKILLEIADRHPKVLAEPVPQALLLSFGEDALKFELRVFVEFMVGLGTLDELLIAIDQAFRQEGIEFAIPRLSIQIPEAKRLVNPLDKQGNPETI